MNRQELADEIEKQIEEAAQMGEPPSFALERHDADMLVQILRTGSHGFSTYVSQPSEYPWTESGHPWADFLQARKRAIEWMHKEQGYHDIVIREALSMDEEQIRLIRMSIAEDLPYKQCPVCGLEASRPECHDQNCPL